MTTAPVFAEEFLDFEITDPGTVKERRPRLRPVPSVCGTCEPTRAARVSAHGAHIYSDCVICAATDAPATAPVSE